MKQAFSHTTNKDDAEVEMKLARVQGQHYFYTKTLPLLSVVAAIFIALIALMPDRGGKSNAVGQVATGEILLLSKIEKSQEPESHKLVVNKPTRVFLYAQPNNKSDILTSVKSASMLLIRQKGEEWTEVLTFDGIPVWVQGKDISSYARGYSKLTTETANAYSKPSIEESEILGTLDDDDILQIIVMQKGWYRVWSPRTFSAWVKTSELEDI